ncbi:MAG TPA: RsmE family RNA methyltransferase [Bacteroidales bacterium]|nr:RsmE family RNA methyltransferase [Bacteroidales bacterium]HSA44285.1 RsmE family RNA methyltransferase [Bacteroidales bacterium]
MTEPTVYAPGLTDDPNGITALDETESFHVCRVLRMRKGGLLMAVSGMGHCMQMSILEAGTRTTLLKPSGDMRLLPLPPYSIHLAVAPPRHPDRLEWLTEKAVETGVDKISLLICKHSEKSRFNTERLQKIMISAMKQSRRAWLPALSGPVPFHDFIRHAEEQEKWIASCAEKAPLLVQSAACRTSCLLTIGPEGDFSSEEMEFAATYGFHSISLGDFRLRTETAALLACHTIHLINALK